MSPFSVYSRKAVVVPWEMMVNKRQAAKKERLVLPHLSQLRQVEPRFDDLVKEGHGGKDQLYLRGKPLPEETFVAPLYVVRVDKIASEIAAVQKGDRQVNHHGIPTDVARKSGQRRDLSKATAMAGRGLHECLAESIRDNISGIHHVRRMACVLEPEIYFEE